MTQDSLKTQLHLTLLSYITTPTCHPPMLHYWYKPLGSSIAQRTNSSKDDRDRFCGVWILWS